jgi:nucleotide-binding universal stress UspA family protein
MSPITTTPSERDGRGTERTGPKVHRGRQDEGLCRVGSHRRSLVMDVWHPTQSPVGAPAGRSEAMTQGTFREGPRVVVGIDGSPGARAAAQFAVREARMRGARLVALIALGLADAAHIDRYSVKARPKREIVARAEETVAATLRDLDTEGLDVLVMVTTEEPGRALIDQAAFADLLVVGSRGRGGFHGLVLGSVSLRCVLHARCAVTVVRPEAAAALATAVPAATAATTATTSMAGGD